MEIRVDGSRSGTENWRKAHLIPVDQLPALSDQEKSVAKKLGITVEEYARSRYAVELTDLEMREKAIKIGNLVQTWLDAHSLKGSVTSIWIKTFEGKYRCDIEIQKRSNSIFIDEDLIDDMLEEGSARARNCFEQVLEINLLSSQLVRAS